jgi:signal transduction histidine kinase
MASPRSSPGTLRERSFLVLGLGAALLLVLAALVGGGDPQSAGRAELVSTAARIAEAVKVEWRAGTCLSNIAEESGAPLLRWSSGKLPFIEGRELARAPGQGHEVFDALFAKSEQVELAQGDVPGALELVIEALGKTEDPARRAEARLRAVQLSERSGRPEIARAQYHLACVELDGSERTGPISYRLLLALALGSDLTNEHRASLLQLIRSGEIALVLPPPFSVTEEDGSVTALLALLEEVCPGARPSDFALLRTGQALRDRFGDLSPGQSPSPQVRRARTGVLCWTSDSNGSGRGYVLDETWVREGLRRGTATFVPEGFVVDVDPPASKATAVREHDMLDGDFGFTVKHEDPEGWIRRSAAKQKLLRGALLLLALLSGAAGFATFRALRRERTLAALKTDFVANVSHELRTPLASILLLSENLEAGRVTSEADKSRYHSLIRREALRLRRLVDDVLDFSRLERGKRIDIRREALRVDPWLERTGEELAEWAREHSLELAIVRSPTDAEAEVDAEALRRALLNLLDNARKHSGGGKVEISAAREGRELVLRVRDHGRGVSAEDRERIFEPFMRLANGDAPGAGLGLSIVREIAREHGGSVRALDPADGPGIVFEMRIPLAEETAA